MKNSPLSLNSPFFDNQNNNNNTNHNNTNNNASNNNAALPQIHTNVCSLLFLCFFLHIFFPFQKFPIFYIVSIIIFFHSHAIIQTTKSIIITQSYLNSLFIIHSFNHPRYLFAWVYNHYHYSHY